MTDIKQQQSYKSMLMFGIFSIVMLFAGLTSAYIVSKGSVDSKITVLWELIPIPSNFLYSTIIIILSSFFLIFSQKELKKERIKFSRILLLFSIICGFLFSYFQYKGWNQLIYPNDIDSDGIVNYLDDDMDGDGCLNIEDFDNDNDGIMDTVQRFVTLINEKSEVTWGFNTNSESPKDEFLGGYFFSQPTVIPDYSIPHPCGMKIQKTTIAASYIYVFSGLHLAHIVFGLFFLIQSYFKMSFNFLSNESNLTFKIKNWFWHFLGFLWIYLYLFIYFFN